MPTQPNNINAATLLGLKEQIENILDTTKEVAATRGPAPAGAAGGSGRLAIVVGHTRNAPGAYGRAPINASEYPWNSDLATRIVGESEAAGVECKVFFRDDIGIAGAYRQVERWGATASVELHFNAFNGTARGTETLYGVDCAASLPWATAVQTALVNLYGRTGSLNRGLKKCPPHPRGGDSVNAMDSIPSCLIEPFFGDSAADARLGQDNKQSLAEALVATFVAQFGTRGGAMTAGKPAAVADFASFIAPIGLRHFTAKEILQPTYNTNGGVANSRPPQVLWQNILPTIVVLDEIRAEAGVAISMNSTYRSKAYNNSLSGAAARSQHLDFRAIDFASGSMKPSALVKIARRMLGRKFTIPVASLNLVKDQAPLTAGGLKIAAAGGKMTFEFHGGVSEYSTFVHIDCRGEDTTWG